MSVIAKLSIRNIAEFGTGSLVELECYCSNDMMAAYAETEENRLFTKYSPWGSMKLNLSSGWSLGEVGDIFYVMMLNKDEIEPERLTAPSTGFSNSGVFPSASIYTKTLCYSLTSFGGDSKNVEFRTATGEGRGVDKLNCKMAVDNPGATDQFRPGEVCWLAFYPEKKFDRDAAIRAAHSAVVNS